MNQPKKTIWFDFTNVPHVNFLLPIIKHFNSCNHIYSIRDFAETRSLFEKLIGKDYYLIGKHKGKNKILKVIGSIGRIPPLQRRIPYFDIKISVGGDASSIVAKLRGKLSITFDDNEKAPNWRYSRFSDLAFWPDAIDTKDIHSQGFRQNKIYQYQGFKEDLYLADYVPDESFLENLPFKDYVVVRPENIQANYVEGKSYSIVPALLVELSLLGVNVLYLPRYKNDVEYANNFKNVFIPESAVNGLDACYFSNAVFTGAGTMAREAACMGVPAFSFYTGKELLTVDQRMIQNGWMFFSRDPKELIYHFKGSIKRETDYDRSKNVKKEILNVLEKTILP